MDINQIVSARYSLSDPAFRQDAKATLDRDGVVVLPNFLTEKAIRLTKEHGDASIGDAYFCASRHNVYLREVDGDLPEAHPRNRLVVSSKGLIADDQLPGNAPLKVLYRSSGFKNFLKAVLGESELHPYADPLSAVNLHFAKKGQELGWHFDNSSFAVTLLIQKPEGGGVFEYVRDVRDADAGELNYEFVERLLDNRVQPDTLEMEAGTLVLFRGRNSIHRVTPTEGETMRMLAVLAYNSEPDIALSESARRTFYGRLG